MKVRRHEDLTVSLRLAREELDVIRQALESHEYVNDKDANGSRPYWWKDDHGDHRAWFGGRAARAREIRRQVEEAARG